MNGKHFFLSLQNKTGFVNITVCSAYESRIANWQSFVLETIDGNIGKPDSLFMEGAK